MAKSIAVSIGHQPSEGPAKVEEHFHASKVATILYDFFLAKAFRTQLFEGSLVEKTQAINIFKADVAIEVHFNALEWPYNPERYGSGYEACINKGSIKGAYLAQCIIDEFYDKLPFDKRGTGIQEREDLWFVRKTKCPAIIVEPLFLDNPLESQYLKMSMGYATIARACYEGIVKFLI